MGLRGRCKRFLRVRFARVELGESSRKLIPRTPSM
jgi:hypothetical protein